VVDDEIPNLETFRRTYRKLYDISVASSGLAGLALMSQREFDVVLSDFSMPGMSGAEFVCKAKRIQPVACVMVTGYVDHPEVILLESAGIIFAVVGKPWEREVIIDVIERASSFTRGLQDGRAKHEHGHRV
jgi:response regulator RpfG family c-di-GMP phosphodiesterase